MATVECGVKSLVHPSDTLFLDMQIFPKHVIEFLSQSKSMPSGRDMAQLARSHKDVTILFMDIVGEVRGRAGFTLLV